MRDLALARTDRWFFTLMAAMAASVVLVGFGPTYFFKTIYATRPLPTGLVHLHGVLLASWMLLFLAQNVFIAFRRTRLHRQLGVFGAWLLAAIVPVSMLITIEAARRGGSTSAPPIPPLMFMAVPFIDLVLFTTFTTAGLLHRHKPDVHKRLMLLGTLALLSAAIGRFFLPPHGLLAGAPDAVAFMVDRGSTDALLLICVLYDALTRRTVHPAFLWGGLGLSLAQHARLSIGASDAWLTFATWLVRP